VIRDDAKDVNVTPDSKTEPCGERPPREESYPDHLGKQGETGSRGIETLAPAIIS
jgi:hypothetical protein